MLDEYIGGIVNKYNRSRMVFCLDLVSSLREVTLVCESYVGKHYKFNAAPHNFGHFDLEVDVIMPNAGQHQGPRGMQRHGWLPRPKF